MSIEMTNSCQHFPQCGGCQHLDLSDEQERALKENKFLETMRSQGIDAQIAHFERSPLYARRRATFSAKRTKKSAIMGFTESKTHNIVDMQSCLIVDPDILALKPALLSMMPIIASRSGIVKFHITKLAHGFDLEIENTKELDATRLQTLAQICAGASIHRVQSDGEILFQDAPPQIEIGAHLINIPPRPFLQATKHAESKLRQLAHDAVAKANQVADLFAGLGTFSFGLRSRAVGFEAVGAMSQAMQENINRLGLHNIEAQTRDLFRDPLREAELAEFDAVIINPPRAGAKAQCEMLSHSNVRVIAFISCDEKSFARDAKMLIDGGYQMGGTTLIDQFRYSNHFESFTVFEKLR